MLTQVVTQCTLAIQELMSTLHKAILTYAVSESVVTFLITFCADTVCKTVLTYLFAEQIRSCYACEQEYRKASVIIAVLRKSVCSPVVPYQKAVCDLYVERLEESYNALYKRDSKQYHNQLFAVFGRLYP